MRSATPRHKLYQYLILAAMGGTLTTTILSFFVFHDIVLEAANLFSFCFYGLMQFLWIKRKNPEFVFSIILYVILEMLLVCIISGFYIGWDGGYQNYCFISFTTSFLYTYETNRKNSIIHSTVTQVTSILAYIILSIQYHFSSPVKILSSGQLELIHQANALIIFIISIFLARVFSTRYYHSIKTLKWEANKDELTQLNNRHAIRKYFDAVRSEKETSGTEFAICILDIDDFKSINDTYGHNIGDDVLKAVASALKSIESDKTFTCRWGGEEFLIINQYGSYKQTFVTMINLLRTSISETVFTYPNKNISFSITLTCGCAFSDTNLKIHEIIDLADNRLYWGKRNGKNTTVFSDN